MDKTYRTELYRTFLIEGLPETLKKSNRHLQITDNYIENTRLRLRKMRSPETKELTFILQKRFPAAEKGIRKVAEIYLNEAEYDAFKIFEGNETRKNRYFFDSNGKIMEIDIFLGDLQGLIIAKVVFDNEKDFEDFEVPPFIVEEVTENQTFYGENLVGKKFIDIQTDIARIKVEN